MFCAPQLDVGLRTRDPRWHCARTFQVPLGDGKAEIFFIDTSPFIDAYRNESWFNQEGVSAVPLVQYLPDGGCLSRGLAR